MTNDPTTPPFNLKNSIAISFTYQLALVVLLQYFLAFTGQGFDGHRLAKLFSNWDARHYMSIAAHGYEASGTSANFIVFFPIFPLLVWILSFAVNPLIAGVIITNIASIIGHAYFILFLQARGFSREKIWRVLILLMLCPISIYFTLNYTEGLLLAITSVFLYYLERRKFLGAAVLGCLAAMTKLIGILFMIPYFFYCITWKPFKIQWRQMFFCALIPCGFGFYSLMNYALFGNALHFLSVQRDHWSKRSVNPLTQYWHSLLELLHGNCCESHFLKQTILLDYLGLLIAPIIVITYVLLRRNPNRIPLGLTIWSFAQLLVFASQSFWLSSFRYTALVLPLYVMIEEITYRIRSAYYLVLTMFALMLLYSCYIFTTGRWLM